MRWNGGVLAGLLIGLIWVVAGVVLVVELVTEGRSVRPAELLGALGIPAEAGRVRRLEQWMHIDGVRRPPVAPDTSRSPVAVVAG